MTVNSGLASKLNNGAFVVTAELLPKAGASSALIKDAAQAMGTSIAAVNVSDNPFGTVTSSLAACRVIKDAGLEPVYQMVSRDRNRIAIQSDILGAATLGIENLVCLTGYHQSLTGCPESANVYDIDSVQMIHAVSAMNTDQTLINGEKIEGDFGMVVGAVANPYLRPLPLNIMKLAKKVEAGATFIQTQAIFDMEAFTEWLAAAQTAGVTDKAKILAGVLPLTSAEEAEELCSTFADFVIPDSIIARMKKASDAQAEGVAIAAEIIGKLKYMDGLKGIHIISGGKEAVVPQLMKAAGLN
ncbi:methylenetetrahydrofolate reductase [Planctomycetota bacterium]